MANNIEVRIVGTGPQDIVTIEQQHDGPWSAYGDVRRWCDLPTIHKIIELHTFSDVYTWALAILPPSVRGGTPCVVLHDYLSHTTVELDIALTDEGIKYNVTPVPLTYA